MGKKLLFVCSGNRDRSPTAEAIFKSNKRFTVKSAGINKNARKKLNEKNLDWADYIFVMTNLHKNYIKKKYLKINERKIKCLHISDRYDFMDDKLVKMIKDKTRKFLRY